MWLRFPVCLVFLLWWVFLTHNLIIWVGIYNKLKKKNELLTALWMTLHDMPELTRSGQVFHCSPTIHSEKASEEKAHSWASYTTTLPKRIVIGFQISAIIMWNKNLKKQQLSSYKDTDLGFLEHSVSHLKYKLD